MAFQMEQLPVKVIQSKRKTISIEIKEEAVIVRTPKGMSRQEINDFLEQKKSWIEKHWNIVQERKKKTEELPLFTKKEIEELAQKAMQVIPQKVKHYAPLVGVNYGRITIRNQRTRWGSCSSKGNLNFNCILMLFPDEVIDSVVVHELCHRKHMDHSAKFYEEVERVFPNYRKCQKWLKEHGAIYLKRMPG